METSGARCSVGFSKSASAPPVTSRTWETRYPLKGPKSRWAGETTEGSEVRHLIVRHRRCPGVEDPLAEVVALDTVQFGKGGLDGLAVVLLVRVDPFDTIDINSTGVRCRANGPSGFGQFLFIRVHRCENRGPDVTYD